MPLTRRQKQVYDFVKDFSRSNGYAPSIDEIARELGLSSRATVHKHLSNLVEKGIISREPNRARSVEVREAASQPGVAFVPLLGMVAAGRPLEAIETDAGIELPESMLGRGNTFVLRVQGDSMIDDHIMDGDYVIVSERETAENGEVVVALVDGSEATIKRFYREGDRVRLQPSNPDMEPIYVPAADVRIRGAVIGILRRF
ncbi:transcriptional repressor LexA [candidate division KSB1 bacterium]